MSIFSLGSRKFLFLHSSRDWAGTLLRFRYSLGALIAGSEQTVQITCIRGHTTTNHTHNRHRMRADHPLLFHISGGAAKTLAVCGNTIVRLHFLNTETNVETRRKWSDSTTPQGLEQCVIKRQTKKSLKQFPIYVATWHDVVWCGMNSPWIGWHVGKDRPMGWDADILSDSDRQERSSSSCCRPHNDFLAKLFECLSSRVAVSCTICQLDKVFLTSYSKWNHPV